MIIMPDPSADAIAQNVELLIAHAWPKPRLVLAATTNGAEGFAIFDSIAR
jgi:hypothetical protein